MRLARICAAFAVCAPAIFAAQPANAQATRTWVSGVGDDVNPCSRTAPCKTFAGAISKTAAGGEINCLDPGGFGAVTIAKSMSIVCDYTGGGALAGGNGITVSAGAGDVVFLSGLDIQGVNPPATGIRFTSGAALYVQNSSIRGFVNAISFEPSGSSQITIRNVAAVNNRAGIRVAPTGNGAASATILDSVIAHNGGAGITAAGRGATIRVGNSTISGNVSGLAAEAEGKLHSYGDNRVHGNGQNGAFNGTASRQ